MLFSIGFHFKDFRSEQGLMKPKVQPVVVSTDSRKTDGREPMGYELSVTATDLEGCYSAGTALRERQL